MTKRLFPETDDNDDITENTQNAQNTQTSSLYFTSYEDEFHEDQTEEDTTPPPFALSPEQRLVAHRLFDLLSVRQHAFGLCTSEVGAGKTYVAAQLLSWLNSQGSGNYTSFVISPKTVFYDAYESMREIYRFPFLFHMNYEMLGTGRAVFSSDLLPTKEWPAHHLMTQEYENVSIKTIVTAGGFLVRRKITAYNKENNKIVHYDVCPTIAGEAFIRQHKLLVIFDECQALKNEGTSRSVASEAFIQMIKQFQPESKFLFMSATPFDKPDQILTFLKLVGVINRPLVITKAHTSPGFDEGIAYCKQFDEQGVVAYLRKNYLDKGGITAGEARNALYIMFNNFAKPRIMFGCPKPRNHELYSQFDYQRRYYCIQDPDELKLLEEGISIMDNAVYNMSKTHFTSGAQKFDLISDFVKGAVMVETAKLPSVVRHARRLLQSTSNTKVVIGINYTSNTEMLLTLLQEFNPLVITGKRPGQKISQKRLIKERVLSIRKFNQHNTDHRLLLIGIRACGTGVSLHDTHGEFPRHVIFMPSYFFMDMLQFIGRFDRINIKSPVYYYCACAYTLDEKSKAKSELMYLESMARKHQVQHDIVDSHIGSSIFVKRVPEWQAVKEISEDETIHEIKDYDL